MNEWMNYQASQKDWLTVELEQGNEYCFKNYFLLSLYFITDGLNEADIINRLFISFSSKDLGWVNENLIAVFEKHSIAYSIHSRDFKLGKPIVQNMADNVYGSRQVLIVLSQNYLASNFCREELHMAIQRGVDSGDSSLILVMINNLKKKQLPAALRSKRLLDFDKHKKKQDWEGKILSEILDGKAASAYNLKV